LSTPYRKILDDAARLTADDLLGLSRLGFTAVFYDTLEGFFLVEALEYISPERPKQFLPTWDRHLRGKDALRAYPNNGTAASPPALGGGASVPPADV
jgi:hypothetical protein